VLRTSVPGDRRRTPGLTLAVLALIAFIPSAGIWGAYRALGGLSSAYRHKRFSDAQLQMLLWLLLIAAPVAAVIDASVRGPTAPPLPLLAGISILTTAVAYRWLSNPCQRPTGRRSRSCCCVCSDDRARGSDSSTAWPPTGDSSAPCA
jgi:hypothetical protein